VPPWWHDARLDAGGKPVNVAARRAPRNPSQLKKLNVTEISSVDRAANPYAHVVLFERDANKLETQLEMALHRGHDARVVCAHRCWG